MAVLSQLSQEVTAWNFTFILSLPGLLLGWNRRLHFFVRVWSLFTDWDSATLQQKIQNLDLIVLLSPMSWCHALLVLHAEIGSLIEQELAHLVPALLDGVVNRPLALGISNIVIGSEFDQLLYSLDVAFSHSIVDRCLSILVLPIHMVSSFTAKVID